MAKKNNMSFIVLFMIGCLIGCFFILDMLKKPVVEGFENRVKTHANMHKSSWRFPSAALVHKLRDDEAERVKKEQRKNKTGKR